MGGREECRSRCLVFSRTCLINIRMTNCLSQSRVVDGKAQWWLRLEATFHACEMRGTQPNSQSPSGPQTKLAFLGKTQPESKHAPNTRQLPQNSSQTLASLSTIPTSNKHSIEKTFPWGAEIMSVSLGISLIWSDFLI